MAGECPGDPPLSGSVRSSPLRDVCALPGRSRCLRGDARCRGDPRTPSAGSSHSLFLDWYLLTRHSPASTADVCPASPLKRVLVSQHSPVTPRSRLASEVRRSWCEVGSSRCKGPFGTTVVRHLCLSPESQSVPVPVPEDRETQEVR